MRLKDKIVLITGGDKGIGRATAILAAKERATVIFTYNSDKTSAENTGAEIKNMAGQAEWSQCDVTDKTKVTELVNSIIKSHGRIDVLINNAGTMQSAQLESTTDEIWNKMMSVNLKGPFNVIQAVAPQMKKQKSGKIVSVSSIGGVAGSLASVSYGAAKAGVINMTKAIARELGKDGITVNAVAPGAVNTDLIKDIHEHVVQKVVGETPLGRIAEPEDIAKAILFFISPDSDYITGQTLIVDGGRL